MASIDLQTGTVSESGAAFALDGRRFNRHTFWCGQSGSGKTYALGVVLEQVLLRTGLPVVIMDPNSDFVGLGSPREDAPDDAAARFRSDDIRVFRPRAEGAGRLVVRFVGMDLASRAALLRLDPIKDAEEYHVLRELDAEFGPQEGVGLIRALSQSEHPAYRKLMLRVENLGLLGWDVWAQGAEGVESVIDSRPAATVLDLGGFLHSEEPAAVALAVLDRLWATREQRRPVLIVVDEAHNLCPPDPTTPARVALCERMIQIAAEGRKFGLWLLLSTQRPSKIHPQVLSQCDNICLMKTNSPADLESVQRLFGAVPAGLLAAVPQFRQGQALFAGGFVSEASVVQLGPRITVEGGSDVAVPSRAEYPPSSVSS